MIYQNIRFALALMLCFSFFSLDASSHREAPLIADDPLADNTDVYAFRSPNDPNTITIIANYIPMQLPHGGPNYYSFGENIRYEIHVDNNADIPGDEIIYRFTFNLVNEDPTTFFNIRLGAENQKNTYNLERSMDGGVSFETIITGGIVPPNNIGTRSITGGAGLNTTYDQLWSNGINSSASTGETVFAGPVDDPFFVDLAGIFDLGDAPRQNGMATDGLECYNVHTIAIQVPISTLLKTGAASQPANILDGDYVIGVWASASRPAMRTLNTQGGESFSGDWVQVSRLGMPLTNEAVIAIGDKDYWNAISPYDEITDTSLDGYFYNPELALYMDGGAFGSAVPALSSSLHIQQNSLGAFDFTNGADGLFSLKGSDAVAGTALDDAIFGTLLLPGAGLPRSVDLWPIFHTGVPNFPPYQLATGKGGNPLAVGKPFINNFLPNGGDMLRLNMAVPVTPRNDANFSSLGLLQAAVLGLTDPTYAGNADLQFIPNMDGFPNGRRLEDDVTRIELQAVSGVVLAAIGLWYDDYDATDPTASPVTSDLLDVLSYTTGVEADDRGFTSAFPYMSQPRSGTGACSGLVFENTNNNAAEAVGQFFVSTNTGGVVGVFNTLDNGSAFFSSFAASGTDADGIAFDEENDVLYQLDRTNNVVVAYGAVNATLDAGGTPSVVATSSSDFTNGRELTLVGNKLIVAQDAADSNGQTNAFYVYDVTANAITLANTYTSSINLWGIHAQDNTLYAIEDNSNNLAVFEDFFANADGAITATSSISVEGIVRTHGVTFDAENDIFVLTDVGSGAVADDGAIVIVGSFTAASADGNISTSEQVRIEGSLTTLGNPVDVALNGDNSVVYVAERANNGGRVLGFNLPSDGGNIVPDYDRAFAGASGIYFVGTDQGDPNDDGGDGGDMTADLSLELQAPSSYPQFTNSIFGFFLTNSGPSAVTGVTVSVPLPDGFFFTSGSTTSGGYNKITEVWTTGTIAAGQTVPLYLTVYGFSGESSNYFTEILTSPAVDPDSTPGNGNGVSGQEDDEDSVSLSSGGNRPEGEERQDEFGRTNVPTAYEMTLYPTLTRGGNTTLLIDAPQAGAAQVIVTDQMGRVVDVMTTDLILGRNRLNVNVDKFANGLYFVNLQAKGAAIPAKRLIKQ